MTGLTDASLSNWNCSMHEWFASFPSSYMTLVVETSGVPAVRPYIIASSGPGIQITLSPQPNNDTYLIDETPIMPVIKATAKVVNVNPDPTATTTFTWSVQLTINRGNPNLCPGPLVDYSNDIVQNTTTKGTGVFTLTLVHPAAFRGGKLALTAKATVNGTQLTGTTPTDLVIYGTNPLRLTIQSYSDSLVPTTGFGDLQAVDIQDALKRVACRESDQLQFRAAADGGTGFPLLSCDRGAGIFQITSGDPTVNAPNVLFNWQTNTASGESIFKNKAQTAKQYPGLLRSKMLYHDYITNTVNPARMNAGLKAIAGFPAPRFTSSGTIGSTPTDQLLEDAVRGYNGYAGSTPFGTALHEFIPDTVFLETVPDAQLPGIEIDPRVWRPVLPAERPHCSACGDPSYVENVIKTTAQCGG
jgi:hypothetical protein